MCAVSTSRSGPVLVFAAANFPFAFSVAGGDTAAALAAGCPVIVKAHPGHPRAVPRDRRIVADALTAAGLPDGVFALIEAREDGVAALRDQRVRAGAFTGSTSAGRALADIAASRPTPIPFYGELGSVNPVFVTEAALRREPGGNRARATSPVSPARPGSCAPKPGFLFVPSPHAARATSIVAAAPKVGDIVR